MGIPEIRIMKMDYLKDEFILMASDGLFDAYSSQKCIDYVRERLVAFPLMEQVFLFMIFFFLIIQI